MSQQTKILIGIVVAMLVLPAIAQNSTPQTTKMQGYLTDRSGGTPQPADGTYSMWFDLYDADVGGLLIASSGELSVPVSNGLYEVDLPFDVDDFGDSERYIEIIVDPDGAGTEPSETLSPRVKIVSAPFAYTAEELDGFDSTDFAVAVHGHVGEEITGGTVSEGVIDAALARDNEVFSIVLDNDGEGSSLDADLLDGNDSTDFLTGTTGWSLTGNAGTVSGTHFVGTTDWQPLDLRIGGTSVVRLFPRAESHNVVIGHWANSADPAYNGQVISGGGYGAGPNQITAGAYAVIAGGHTNTLSGNYSAIQGGTGHQVSGFHNVIDGGDGNQINGVELAKIGGGRWNTVTSSGSTIGGGYENTSGGWIGTIGGGYDNEVTGEKGTVGGGEGNTAGGSHGVVGGGVGNSTGGHPYGTVAGGRNNTVTNYAGTVCGGEDNTAGGIEATVGGGTDNEALADHGVVPGGQGNSANGRWSLAAGRFAAVNNHDGVFIWADSTGAAFASNTHNQFKVRAAGGVIFYTDAAATTGVSLAAGGGSWSTVSDENLKHDFATADPKDVLARLMTVPIRTWSYRSQDPSIRHIGPTAQSFASVFGFGPSDRSISTIDADGVALASIQGLYQLVQQKDQEIEKLEQRLAELENRMAMLSSMADATSLRADR